MTVVSRSLSLDRRRAFTLIEILVVISIIGLLVAILIPAAQAAREAARRSHCMNNFKQYGLALQSYLSVYDTFPPCSSGNTAYSMHVLTLPYIEQSSLYNTANLMLPAGYSPQNSTLVLARVQTLLCPSDPYINGQTRAMACMTNYAANLGDDREPMQPNGALYFRAARTPNIPDGYSSTVSMSEFLVGRRGVTDRLRSIFSPTGGAPADVIQFSLRCKSLDREASMANSVKGENWVMGQRDYSIYNHVITPNQPTCFNTPGSSSPLEGTTATSHHPGGVNCLFADGHVQFIRDSVNEVAWRAIGTRNGGEVVSTDSY